MFGTSLRKTFNQKEKVSNSKEDSIIHGLVGPCGGGFVRPQYWFTFGGRGFGPQYGFYALFSHIRPYFFHEITADSNLVINATENVIFLFRVRPITSKILLAIGNIPLKISQ